MYFIYSPGHELEARQGHSFTAKAYGFAAEIQLYNFHFCTRKNGQLL